MKKTLFTLMGIMLLLVGCNNDEIQSETDAKLPPEEIHWYGSQLPQPTSTRGVANGSKLWAQEENISIKFLNLPADRSLIDTVKLIAAEWEKYANIKFNFVSGNADADVRIAFDWMGNKSMTWSYTGTDAKSETNQRVPTAVFAGLDKLNEKERKGDILRLFGQILGLEYEQRHQLWAQNGYWTDESQLQAYWEGLFKHYYNLKWDEIRDYVFTPMTQSNTSSLYATKDIDKQSIMAWPYYDMGQSNLLIANYDLSAGDKAFIATLYPKDKQLLPTIQEAWVDAGYFEWLTPNSTYGAQWVEGTVALRLTRLGAWQEYLPDVCDGEQLNSAENMFYGKPLLKKVPKFNTSNITNFKNMFLTCQYITEVPVLDTSKGTDFSGMFSHCTSLTSIPLIDTSNGTNFSGMFTHCDSLKTIPLLNTSNGINFEWMFESSRSLITISLINTSKGTNFNSMFSNCYSLISIPNLNTSNGNDFLGMFYNCKSLTSKPQLDLSKATETRAMYEGTPFDGVSL